MDCSNTIALFSAGLRFMQELGFAGPKVTVETSRLAGEGLLLIYDGKSIGRRVEVSYLAAQRGRPAVIAVFIAAGTGKRFSVEDWLSANRIAKEIEFSLENSTLNENLFIERFCGDFKELCDQELRGILLGNVWQDVPIDWKGYR